MGQHSGRKSACRSTRQGHRHTGFGIAALLLLVTMAPAWGAIGRTPGVAGVTRNGDASYVIPIRSSAGAAGLAPQLSIAYTGTDARGILGVGFSISGLSAVTPCARTIAQDGAAAPVTLTSSDQYCVDGQRLRLTSGTYGANNAQYRTEVDLAMRATSYGASGQQPTWFRIERADGLIYEYGNSTSSRARSSTSSNAVTFVWALSKVVDRSGNAMTFVYENDAASRVFRPDFINYTSSAAAGDGDYRVDFVYQSQDRDDPVEHSTPSTSEAATLEERRLLARLELRRLGVTYRQYVFTYGSGAGSNSQLVSVQECAVTTADCLAATTFAWQSATPGFGSPDPASTAVTPPVFPLDLNGDGYEDLAWAQGGTWRTMLGSSSGYGPASDSGISAVNPARAMVLEWNGDGRADLLVDWSDGNWRVLRGAVAGFAAPAQAGAGGIANTATASSWSVADVDGDGRDDLVKATASTRNFNARLNSASGFGAEMAYSLSLMLQPTDEAFAPSVHGTTSHRRIDFDGDGREDIVAQGCQFDIEVKRCITGDAWWVFMSNGDRLLGQDMLYASGSGTAPVFGDFNADRLTDIAYARTDGRIGLALSRGRAGFSHLTGPSTSGYVTTELRVADHDGDGYDDLLVARNPSSGVYSWHVFRGTGTGMSTTATATSVPGLGTVVSDVNGDGLADLARLVPASGLWGYHPHNGVPAGDLVSATDGYGVTSTWLRAPMSLSSVYTKGSGAAYPVADLGGPRSVVRELVQADGTGTGSTYSLKYRYEAARVHLQGRGFLGFGKRVITDDRGGWNLQTEETYLQAFPHIGLPATIVLRQSNGLRITETTNAWSALSAGTPQVSDRRMPYLANSTTKDYTLGAGVDGVLFRTASTVVASVDPTSGLVLDQTTTLTENSTGISSGSARSVRTQHTSVLNDATNWCLGKPQATQVTAGHTDAGGTAVTRSYAQVWNGSKCRVTQKQVQPGDAKLQVTTGFGYDAFGNITTESVTGIGMSVRTTKLGWGTKGQFPETLTNALGQVTTLTWDPALGVPLSVSDPNALVTTWTHDAFGRLASETRPDQTATAWVLTSCSSGCTARGRYRQFRSEKGTTGSVYRTQSVEFDRHERAFRIATDMPGGGDSISELGFDERGDLILRSIPMLQGSAPTGEWRYVRDALGRVTNEELRTESGSVRRTIGHEYEGLRTAMTDARGQVTTTITSVAGGPVRVTDALGRNTQYEYDAFGQLVGVVDSGGVRIGSITYNVAGMKTSQTDVDLGTWTFDRNALGEVTRVRDAKTAGGAWTTTYTYDLLSRVTGRTDVPESLTTTFVYGTAKASRNIGQLQSTALSDGSYSENYTFDTAGRLSRRRIVSDATYDYDYTYNTLGKVQTLRYPVSTASFRLSLGYEYTNGYLTRIVDPAPEPDSEIWRLVAMDGAGRVLDERLGSGIQVVSGFDPQTGELTDTLAGTNSGTSLQDLQYEWDAGGNLTKRVDHQQSALTETFAYDALNRLDRSWRNGTLNLDVTYDSIGNITSKFEQGVGTLDYSYDATRRHAVVTAGGNTYAYDANGNMRLRNGTATTWFSFNQPRVLGQAGGNSSQFSYGPDRNRWKQVATEAGVTQTTIYVGGLLERVTRNGVTTWRHYIQAPGGTAAVYLRHSSGIPATATYYLTHDHLGSTHKIINAAGTTVAAEQSFSAYGRRRGKTWSGVPTAAELTAMTNVTRDGYTGHESLDHVGLVHMNGRVYDPLIGRFLSADPYVQAPYDAQSLNRYSYVFNNPLSLVDPSGYSALDDDPPIYCNFSCTVWYMASHFFGWVPSQIRPPIRPQWPVPPRGVPVPTYEYVPPEPRLAPPVSDFRGLSIDSVVDRLVSSLGEQGTGPGEVAARAGYALSQDAAIPDNVKLGIGAGGMLASTGVVALALAPEALPFLAVGLEFNAASEGMPARFGPLSPGPLPTAVAGTFRGGSYTAVTLTEPTILYRVYGGQSQQLGSFWSRTPPHGPLGSTIDLALKRSWGNTAQNVVRIRAPAGTRLYEGAAASQDGLVGGGNQIVLPNVDPAWVVP